MSGVIWGGYNIPMKPPKKFWIYSGTFCTWCMLRIDCQETNAMQLPCILIFPTRGGVIPHRSGGFRIHCFRMPNQGTTTKSFNQGCTDVTLHSKGTRPSWQTSVLPASWFIQSPHLHWDILKVDWVWKRSHVHS